MFASAPAAFFGASSVGSFAHFSDPGRAEDVPEDTFVSLDSN